MGNYVCCPWSVRLHPGGPARGCAAARQGLQPQGGYLRQREEGHQQGQEGWRPNTGVSEEMNKKTFVDASGRKGKGYGVFRFDSKYGANVDGYSPIWSPNEWSETGDEYSGGTLGLVVWFALLSAGLGLAGYLIFSTSALA